MCYLRLIEVNVGRLDANASRIENGIGNVAGFDRTHAAQFVVTGNEEVTGPAVSDARLRFAAAGRRVAKCTVATESTTLLFDAQL